MAVIAETIKPPCCIVPRTIANVRFHHWEFSPVSETLLSESFGKFDSVPEDGETFQISSLERAVTARLKVKRESASGVSPAADVAPAANLAGLAARTFLTY